MQLINLPVKEFLAATASNEPVPGGGSVSALCGAIAASLGQMVAGLTIGRKKYADVEPEMTLLAETFKKSAQDFMLAVDADAGAYNLVMAAYKLPKDTDEQRSIRTNVIEQSLHEAALVPLNVAQMAVALMPSIATVARKGNQNAVTDACVAMMTARTATLGAILNVKINLASIKDEKFVAEISAQCDSLSAQAIEAESALLQSITI